MVLSFYLRDVWLRDRPSYVYGGVRVLPMRGMERSLQSTFPRIQVALRRSMHDFQVHYLFLCLKNKEIDEMS